MNSEAHQLNQLIIQLAIAYTLVGAFIFTVIVTCLSLVGWAKIVNRNHQNKLFYTLIVELVVIGLASFSGFLNFSPDAVAEAAMADAENKIENQSVEQVLEALEKRAVQGMGNIHKTDVEAVLKGGKLPEAVAIFQRPNAREVKKRQFAVYLVELNRLHDAFTICSAMTNRAEIRNVAVSVVDRLHQGSTAEDAEWKFLCDIFQRFTDRQRDEVFKRINDRGVQRRCQWADYTPADQRITPTAMSQRSVWFLG